MMFLSGRYQEPLLHAPGRTKHKHCTLQHTFSIRSKGFRFDQIVKEKMAAISVGNIWRLLLIAVLSYKLRIGLMLCPRREELLHDIVCEDNDLTMTCCGGLTVNIINVSYGYNYNHSEARDKCDGFWNRYSPFRDLEGKDCSHPNSTSIASSVCNGFDECTIVASNEMFPDPCKGVTKYLEVEFNCVEGEGRPDDAAIGDDNDDEKEDNERGRETDDDDIDDGEDGDDDDNDEDDDDGDDDDDDGDDDDNDGNDDDDNDDDDDDDDEDKRNQSENTSSPLALIISLPVAVLLIALAVPIICGICFAVRRKRNPGVGQGQTIVQGDGEYLEDSNRKRTSIQRDEDEDDTELVYNPVYQSQGQSGNGHAQQNKYSDIYYENP